jgi:hypothetical protein
MSVQTDFLDVGFFQLSTANDARKSSITGTTLAGPNGSGQFLGVVLSTGAAFTCQMASSTSGVSGSTLGLPYLGILQNAPAPGNAADIKWIGISKAVCGAAVAIGNQLQFSSTLAGVVVPWASGQGRTIGSALEVGVAGQVVSVMLYPWGNGGGST